MIKSGRNLREHGQAMVEYLLIAMLAIILTVKIVNMFSGFFRDSMGNLGHVLTVNLMVGVCPRDCFFESYKNNFGVR